MRTKLIAFFSFTIVFLEATCQEYTPGQSYFDANGYVEYIPGTLPIVISAPHGGYLEPANIPDRDCEDCTYVGDAYTQELAREIGQALFEITGCYPHIVINLLHRNKFDANRDLAEAADGNTTVEAAWSSYHEFITLSKAKIGEDAGRGLFLDMHGHGHEIQRIELGYLFDREELQLSDSELNTPEYIVQSSIRTLVDDNLQSLSLAELVRGVSSLGTLLENKGIRSVPSMQDPFPMGSESFFRGGYNTARHGSSEGGNIDAIQLECHNTIRKNDDLRQILADSLAKSVNQFIKTHYNANYESTFCNDLELGSTIQTEDINIFPNPASNLLTIQSQLGEIHISVYNLFGQQVAQYQWTGSTIDISQITGGLYFMEMTHGEKILGVKRLIVR